MSSELVESVAIVCGICGHRYASENSHLIQTGHEPAERVIELSPESGYRGSHTLSKVGIGDQLGVDALTVHKALNELGLLEGTLASDLAYRLRFAMRHRAHTRSPFDRWHNNLTATVLADYLRLPRLTVDEVGAYRRARIAAATEQAIPHLPSLERTDA